MKKLKLQLDDLRIDSFDTTEPQKAKGTVLGEQCTCYTECSCPGCPTCGGYDTCDATCAGETCNASCANSCVDYETCFTWTEVSCAYDTCTCGGGPRTSLC